MSTAAITTFERKEIKYLLTPAQKQPFLNEVIPYLKPDENGEGGNYKLISLYYDSPEKDLYREKQAQFKERRKIRIRRYLNSTSQGGPDEQVFIEIKEHTEAMNYKRRVLLRADDAQVLLRYGILPELSDQDEEVIQEIAQLAKIYHLEPSAFVGYQRQAFKAKKQYGGIRITFDQNIEYRVHDLSLEPIVQKSALLPAGMEVMEIKVKDELPEWTQNALHNCGIEQVHFSKYVQAIDLGFEGKLTPPLALGAYEKFALIKSGSVSPL